MFVERIKKVLLEIKNLYYIDIVEYKKKKRKNIIYSVVSFLFFLFTNSLVNSA